MSPSDVSSKTDIIETSHVPGPGNSLVEVLMTSTIQPNILSLTFDHGKRFKGVSSALGNNRCWSYFKEIHFGAIFSQPPT